MITTEDLIRDICGEDIINEHEIDAENVTDILTDGAQTRIMSDIFRAQELALAKEVKRWKSEKLNR